MLRFDAQRPGEVTLDAVWRIYGRDGTDLLRDSRSRITVPVAEPGDGPALGPAAEMPPVVAAMSEATVRLSREIATAIAAARN